MNIGIIQDLSDRMDRYRRRYGSLPTHLPVTLDEWGRLGEAMRCARGELPVDINGVPLRLVECVIDLPDGAIAVRA